MSKAEDLAFERYPDYRAMDGGYITQRNKRMVYVEGYNQAKKDNELSWEEIEKIVNLYEDIHLDFSFEGKGDLVNTKEHYQEVLKRFKDLKK